MSLKDYILAAYEASLAGRDPASVNIFELLPAICETVPDASDDDIIAALRSDAERLLTEAQQLRRYGQAKFQRAF